MQVAGFVLVGGASRRMGCDKALLEFGGTPLLVRAAELLRPRVNEFFLLGPRSRYSHFGYPVLEDEYGVQCPLAGVSTGLKHSRCEWNLFLACDLPFVTESVVEVLLQRTAVTTAEALVPRVGGRWEPLCAAYRRTCLLAMERAIELGKLSVVDLLPELSVEPVVGASNENSLEWERALRNVNTAADWQEARHARESVSR